MKINAHFFLLNDDFSPEYAEANHGGKESDNNPLYEWEDEFSVSEELEDVVVEEKSVYLLQGETNDGPFSYEIPNMLVARLKMKNGVEGAFAISESIVDSYTFEKEEETVLFKVFIKDYEPLADPIPGVYIASKEFPTDLARD
jgi:hypothetical protein